MLSKILYIIVLLVMIAIACPIAYAIFQLIIMFFGSTYDDITGTNDYFMWEFS